MKFELSEEQKNEAIMLYKQKVPLSELSKRFGCCDITMSKYLKKNGTLPSKKGYIGHNRFSQQKEAEIVNLYKKGYNQKEIAKMYNTYNTSIRRVLVRQGVSPRPITKVARYCKHNPFKSDSKHDEKSEYFLGLLLTDGCISKGRKAVRVPSINLSLSDIDGYMVEQFRDWASPKQVVSKVLQKINNSYMYSVNITNEEAVEWLNRKGNFKNKSFNAKIYCPITWHILRGIFDGDGSWKAVNNNQGLHFFVCGLSKDFMYQVYNFLQKNNLNVHIRFVEPDKWHKNGLYYVEICSYVDAIKVGLNMYSNAHIYLKRKYDKWLTFYESRRDKYTLNSGKEWHSNPEQNLPTLEVISN